VSDAPRALLLIGSPKRENSTSAALGGYVLEKLKAAGFSTKTMHVGHELRDDDGQLLVGTVDAADLVILAVPLYVDAAPAPVTRMMERIARHRRQAQPEKRPRLAAIVNCGFPEARQNETALAIYRRFAEEAGLAWAGGLGIGMGGAIGGRAVEKLGGMGRHLRQALDLAADALAEGEDVPEEAIALAAKPFMPRWVYVAMAHLGWRRQAAANDAGRKLKDQPHKATD
jgi:multimeric flavodoxin WrbA